MDRRDAMTASWRKPFGMFAIILLIIAWCALVASASGEIARLPWLAQLAVYATAGIVWALPLRPALRWMETGRWRRAR